MRIAQIAPLFETVPPARYGGTERVVSWLTEALVGLGHDVTLFASGDSRTGATLVPVIPRARRFEPNFEVNTAPYARMIELVARQADAFDVLHFHTDFHAFPVFSRQRVPFLTTLHGRMDQEFVRETYGLFPDAKLVSISDNQRVPVPDFNWAGTVYHGMPRDLLRPVPGRSDYLAFLGRVSPEKGIEAAIRIAASSGLKLKIAAKIGAEDQGYYDRVMAPLLAAGSIEFIGEIDDRQKPAFLSGARALLFPIQWPEPFGLVMIEAMACGCPVIATRQGSVPEVVEDGVTGFVIDNEVQALAAISHLGTLDRVAIRARFEQRWCAERMARDYVEIYREMVAGEMPQQRFG